MLAKELLAVLAPAPAIAARSRVATSRVRLRPRLSAMERTPTRFAEHTAARKGARCERAARHARSRGLSTALDYSHGGAFVAPITAPLILGVSAHAKAHRCALRRLTRVDQRWKFACGELRDDAPGTSGDVSQPVAELCCGVVQRGALGCSQVRRAAVWRDRVRSRADAGCAGCAGSVSPRSSFLSLLLLLILSSLNKKKRPRKSLQAGVWQAPKRRSAA